MNRAVILKRQVEFRSAVMLGFVFKLSGRTHTERWQFFVPDHIAGKKGWRIGFHKWRHEAVTSALQQAGLLPE